MASESRETPITPNIIARLATAARYAITGVTPDTWFGPQQPLTPQAPPDVKGRQWDYPFGVNLNYTPRSDSQLSFAELRALADALPLLRTVIETRKDQIAALGWAVRPIGAGGPGASQRASQARAFLAFPDRRHAFSAWLRMWLEDMLVIDAACLYPRYAQSGALWSLDVIDGATITPLIGEDGRAPDAPDPAYQQILHGVPAADFAVDELMYLPRNPRTNKLYGFSPVEQVALTVNIALRRDQATLDYYRAGSTPDAFATLPHDWTVDQIRQFQDYFDALMSGNAGRRRMVKFMPSEFKLIETRQPPLKDSYDEWLARVICYAFSVPVSPFVNQVNRATSQTLRMQATQEGLVPLKAWIKAALDHAIQSCMKQPDLEFVWVGDDAIDPLQQAQTLVALVGAGIKTREEARAELGLGGEAKGLGKYSPNQARDDRGRWASGGGGGDGAGGSSPSSSGESDRGRATSDSSQEVSVHLAEAGNPITTGAEGEDVQGDDSTPQLAVADEPAPKLGERKYSVQLADEEEKWGGHGVRDHVGKTADELIDELSGSAITDPVDGGTYIRRNGEGTFESTLSANDFVNRILEDHQLECDKVAAGEWDKTWINQRFGFPTGIEAFVTPNGRISTRKTYNVGLLIVHDDRVPRGYRVKTTYPNNINN